MSFLDTLENQPTPQAPTGGFLDKLGAQPGTLNNPNQPKEENAMTDMQDAFHSGIQQAKQGFQQSQDAGNQGGFGGFVSGLEGGVKTVAGAANAVFSPLAVFGKPIGEVVNYAADKISNIPAVQKFAMSNAGQTTARVAEDVGNVNTLAATGTGFSGGEKVPEVANLLKEKALGTPEERMNANINKAIPVLKKDVKTMATKQSNIKTAFTDIVANKEGLGLTDKAGNPRNPTNFTETVASQQARKSQIYNEYSSKLSTVDKAKFETDINNGIKDQVKSIDGQLAKENTLDGRRALTKLKTELSTMRDTSPEGIQKYVEDINQRLKTAPGAPLSVEQIKLANLGGEMRKLLDSSVEKTGAGYQDLRNLYGAHRAIEDQLLMAAKKEMNNVPGLTDKLTTAGATIEGINFLVTHNPQSLAIGLGLKGLAKWKAYINSPTTALGRIFKQIESESQSQPKSLSPQTISPTANSSSNIINQSDKANMNNSAVPTSNTSNRIIPESVAKKPGIIKGLINRVKETPNKQGGFIRIGGKKFSEIPEATKAEMVKAIDYLRNGKQSANIEDTVSRLAKKHNISENQPNSKIANKLEDLIDKTKTK